jgi:hypothetical protein
MAFSEDEVSPRKKLKTEPILSPPSPPRFFIAEMMRHEEEMDEFQVKKEEREADEAEVKKENQWNDCEDKDSLRPPPTIQEIKAVVAMEPWRAAAEVAGMTKKAHVMLRVLWREMERYKQENEEEKLRNVHVLLPASSKAKQNAALGVGTLARTAMTPAGKQFVATIPKLTRPVIGDKSASAVSSGRQQHQRHQQAEPVARAVKPSPVRQKSSATATYGTITLKKLYWLIHVFRSRDELTRFVSAVDFYSTIRDPLVQVMGGSLSDEVGFIYMRDEGIGVVKCSTDLERNTIRSMMERIGLGRHVVDGINMSFKKPHGGPDDVNMLLELIFKVNGLRGQCGWRDEWMDMDDLPPCKMVTAYFPEHVVQYAEQRHWRLKGVKGSISLFGDEVRARNRRNFTAIAAADAAAAAVVEAERRCRQATMQTQRLDRRGKSFFQWKLAKLSKVVGAVEEDEELWDWEQLKVRGSS